MKRHIANLRALLQKLCCCQIPFRLLWTVKYPHPVGIVIGDGVQVGQGVRIYQNVTIGRRENDTDGSYPRVGDEVVIYAGAVIAGAITIGPRTIIGANAVITRDIPPDSVAFGHNQHRPRKAAR